MFTFFRKIGARKQAEVYAQILNEELDKAMEIFNEPKKDGNFSDDLPMLYPKRKAICKFSVIPLGLEPRAPTLKVLCSTN